MASTNTAGGYDSTMQGGYQIDFDAMLWQSLGSNPSKTTWWNVFALVLQSLIVSSIVTKTFQYFEYFQKSDNSLYLGFVGLGCSVSIAALGLTCAQTYKLVYHAATEFHTIYRFLYMVDQTILLIGAFFNASAAIYYAHRAWSMANKKRWLLPPLAIVVIAPFISAFVVVIKGYKLPALLMENLPSLPGYFEDYIHSSRVWGALTLAMDATLCLSLTTLLLRSKDSIFHNETRLLHNLFALMYESMLPPVILLLILESADQVAGSPTSDWRKFVITCVPTLYFHSVLSALVGRQTIRGLLHNKLKKEGGEISLLSSGKSSGGISKAFTNHTYPSTDLINPKLVEEGNGSYKEMKSDIENGSQVSMIGPMVKVRIEHNSNISEPDNYAINHPHLSPTGEYSTANRDSLQGRFP
ncbi:uncharacterized protein I206_102074 [Kwoniella pini CBS 10737]|uniref:Integral membrane protein n=1 Tax=Kwoniella pini CBS 10737 TaxID=1296096 RepID=A0A1B9HUW6_9TREE|nr:uncharacterized protein I206_06833 [Kwoniella pini CBS 10737]OCF47059.1 hypothetical protein I206_06833 [Kwoniella pini CBS 10737]